MDASQYPLVGQYEKEIREVETNVSDLVSKLNGIRDHWNALSGLYSKKHMSKFNGSTLNTLIQSGSFRQYYYNDVVRKAIPALQHVSESAYEFPSESTFIESAVNQVRGYLSPYMPGVKWNEEAGGYEINPEGVEQLKEPFRIRATTPAQIKAYELLTALCVTYNELLDYLQAERNGNLDEQWDFASARSSYQGLEWYPVETPQGRRQRVRVLPAALESLTLYTKSGNGIAMVLRHK